MKLHLPGHPALELDRPAVMGILNVTPDSFSDGGKWNRPALAAAQALAMAREGAALIDVGGESTRPGASRVPAEEQVRRTLEPIERIRAELDRHGFGHVAISIDTTLAPVAEAALGAGAAMVNDVSAGREDSAMLPLAAERGAPLCLMHMQGEPGTMQENPQYGDVVAEVEAFLLERAAAAEAAGLRPGQIVLDPGIGFGKRTAHNLALLAALPRLLAHGYPVLLGTSRKRFMGELCARPDGTREPPEARVGATCATTALGAAAGVRLFRVHDVGPNRQAALVARAISAPSG